MAAVLNVLEEVGAMSAAKRLVRICCRDDIDSGAILQVSVAGLPTLAIYRLGDEFYCTDDLCTHGAASLSDEGDLNGYIIECSWHEGKFDIRTGQPCALPCTVPLKTYAVVLQDHDVFIEIAGAD
jgi:nitrite reductase/ring-hydroxylating ferredoxin subunit